MNDLIQPGGIQTMSSREIAELTGKRHDNVKRTIETLLNRGVIASPQSEEKPTAGRTATEYVFSGEQGKRDSIVVVAQLCPEFTARLVDRWAELEAAVARPDPLKALNDPATMRGLLLTYSEKVLALEEANAALTPKAEALDRIASADGALNITAAAKALQMRPKSLFSYLQAQSWIYRRTGSSGWLGYQSKVTTGLLEHKVTTVQRNDGSEKVVEQVLVTAKGLTKLATLLQPHH